MYQELTQWCSAQLLDDDIQLITVSGDASFRVYYRVFSGSSSYIAVNAPPETEKNHEFVNLADVLSKTGILAPKVLAADYERGFLLLTDLGDQLLLPLLTSDSAASLYRQAFDSLILLQGIKKLDVDVMPYDVNALQQELNVFTQWFTGSLLDYDLNDDDHAVINELSRLLIDSAVAQPQCLVHRDYHARNIMLFENQIAMIDFQDALWGPISYDVVSLLKDCYIKWPRDLTITCLNDYYTLVCSQREMPDFKMFVEQFDLMGLQRHIKVLGVFSRLSKRDNKHAYLNDLPRVIEYVRETAAMYPQTQNFVIWFDKHLLPLAEKQHWYKQVSI